MRRMCSHSTTLMHTERWLDYQFIFQTLPLGRGYHPTNVERSRRGIILSFCNVSLHLPLAGTLFFCITEWYGTLVFYVIECSPVLPCLLVVCCYVCPGLGMNCMHDLGVEETLNEFDKPSEERNLTKR